MGVIRKGTGDPGQKTFIKSITSVITVLADLSSSHTYDERGHTLNAERPADHFHTQTVCADILQLPSVPLIITAIIDVARKFPEASLSCVLRQRVEKVFRILSLPNDTT